MKMVLMIMLCTMALGPVAKANCGAVNVSAPSSISGTLVEGYNIPFAQFLLTTTLVIGNNPAIPVYYSLESTNYRVTPVSRISGPVMSIIPHLVDVYVNTNYMNLPIGASTNITGNIIVRDACGTVVRVIPYNITVNDDGEDPEIPDLPDFPDGPIAF